jgi:PIN domain nuclease of toxin-antitoxin system
VGASYLLDTHAVLWLVTGSRRVRPRVLEALDASGAAVLVSAVSAFEVATKVKIGKLAGAGPLVAAWAEGVRELGAEELALTAEHAVTGGGLHWSHADPFDRLLVGQAQVEGLTLVTADRSMLAAPGIDVLPW